MFPSVALPAASRSRRLRVETSAGRRPLSSTLRKIGVKTRNIRETDAVEAPLLSTWPES